MEKTRKDKNGAAAVLSFLLPGLGQLYKGQLIGAFFGFIITMIAYFPLVIPGLILHALMVINAATEKHD